MDARVAIIVGYPTKELKKKVQWPNLSRIPEVGHMIRTKSGAEAQVKAITHCEDEVGPYIELLVEPNL